MVFRKPTEDEARLLGTLATVGKLPNVSDWLLSLHVREMEDGGMGSLEFEVGPDVTCTGIVVCIGAVRFIDSDGIEVMASLNATVDGIPFELDMWKTNFSPVIEIPSTFETVESSA